jgi:mono/diheme cytochrome c family protein
MQFFRIHSGPMLRSDRGRKTAFFRSLLEEHMKKTLALALLFAGTVGVAVSAQAVDSRARFMAANCAYCHGPDGKSRGAIPSLAGLDKGYFVDQMKAFRDGPPHRHAESTPWVTPTPSTRRWAPGSPPSNNPTQGETTWHLIVANF